MTTLATTKQLKLSELLAARICNDIRDGSLQPGTPYLTEARIAEEHHMSRPIVREAISRLQALGILESRQGSGLTVCKSDPAKVFATHLPFFDTDEESLLHLAEFRYTLEIGAIGFAAINATREQIERLNALAAAHERAFRQEKDDYKANQIDQEFHCLILEMTHNSLISSMHQVIVDYMTKIRRSAPPVSEASLRADWQHHAICDAISRHDAEQARFFMVQHLDPLVRPEADEN